MPALSDRASGGVGKTPGDTLLDQRLVRHPQLIGLFFKPHPHCRSFLFKFLERIPKFRYPQWARARTFLDGGFAAANRRRWIMERTFRRLQNPRRWVNRWDHPAETSQRLLPPCLHQHISNHLKTSHHHQMTLYPTLQQPLRPLSPFYLPQHPKSQQ